MAVPPQDKFLQCEEPDDAGGHGPERLARRHLLQAGRGVIPMNSASIRVRIAQLISKGPSLSVTTERIAINNGAPANAPMLPRMRKPGIRRMSLRPVPGSHGDCEQSIDVKSTLPCAVANRRAACCHTCYILTYKKADDRPVSVTSGAQ